MRTERVLRCWAAAGESRLWDPESTWINVIYARWIERERLKFKPFSVLNNVNAFSNIR